MAYAFSTTSLSFSILTLRGWSGLKGKALSSTNAFSKYTVCREPTFSILVVVWLTIVSALVCTVFNTTVFRLVRKYLYTHLGIEDGAHQHEHRTSAFRNDPRRVRSVGRMEP